MDLYSVCDNMAFYVERDNNAAVIFYHHHPPGTRLGICTKNLSSLWGFCILKFLPGACRFVGIGPEEQAFWSILQFLPFLEFSFIYSQELGADNTLVFICCFKILYLFKENYSNFIKHDVKSCGVKSVIFIKHKHL